MAATLLGRFARIAAGSALAALAASTIGRRRIVGGSGDRITSDPGRVRARVAAVLGAGLRPDGSPTALLASRVEGGVELYRRGAVELLVMSGYDGSGNDRANQPEAMARLARSLGVPADRIQLDPTGVDTAATCRRLRLDYGTEPVALVTQEFHAARTAYLAVKAGLDAIVFATPDAQVRRKALVKARIREVPASVKAILLDRFS